MSVRRALFGTWSIDPDWASKIFPRVSTARLMILILFATAPFVPLKTLEYRDVLQLRSKNHRDAANICRNRAQWCLDLATGAEEHAEKDIALKQQGRAGMSRATYRFTRDGRQVALRLRADEDPPERWMAAVAEFAAAVRTEAERNRQLAGQHDALSSWYRSWGPWLPALARGEDPWATVYTGITYGSGYSYVESGIATRKGPSSAEDDF
jgi:hypothetical protein